NGASNRPRLRDDLVRRHGHEIPTRTGKGAHGDDHRLASLPRSADLPPNSVGRNIGTAWAIHTKEYGFDAVVFGSGTQRTANRVRAHCHGAGNRIEVTLAAFDATHPINERDRLAPRMRPPHTTQVLGNVEESRPGAGLLFSPIVNLIAIRQTVH